MRLWQWFAGFAVGEPTIWDLYKIVVCRSWNTFDGNHVASYRQETEEQGDRTQPRVRRQQVSMPIHFQDLFTEERQDHGTVLILCSTLAADRFSKSKLGAKKAYCYLVHKTPGLSNTDVLCLLQAGRPALFQQQQGLPKHVQWTHHKSNQALIWSIIPETVNPVLQLDYLMQDSS